MFKKILFRYIVASSFIEIARCSFGMSYRRHFGGGGRGGT